jgi:alkanesulfonate monooxygenase SsuD/methylene tetrahydromethanopterin reductase-like flavin-dependent oxidoreductase (luciferase family)
MRALWSGPRAEFHGEFVDFPPVTSSPRPVQSSIPIVVGGDTDAAIRRAAKLADGYFPGEGDPTKLAALIGRVREAAERAGRDPLSITINATFAAQLADPVAGAEQLAEIGVDRAMVPAFFFAGDGGLDRLDAFGDQVSAVAERP